ncbi:MAG: tyrosine-type recombinase/integrase [Desulfobacteraceae bacterium]|nr:tyrosine-type recombinase/integrase [Desulfobacteraceae bacterium]
MTELRRKFENHLILRRYSPKTSTAYVNAVKSLAKYYRLSPDRLTDNQVQDYLLYLLKEKRLAWNTCNVHFSGIKHFYTSILKRDITLFLPPRPRIKKICLALSKDEVRKLIFSCTNLKHRTLLLTVYSAGLRVSEVVKLEPSHIERSRKMLRVEQGKGRKDRYTLLSDQLLEALGEYWREYRPGKYLFFGKTKSKPMPVETAQKIYYKAKKDAGIKRGKGIHTLRHCFATHLMEHGTSTIEIKHLMGHSSIRTTAKYLHVTNGSLSKIISPLDMVTQ